MAHCPLALSGHLSSDLELHCVRCVALAQREAGVQVCLQELGLLDGGEELFTVQTARVQDVRSLRGTYTCNTCRHAPHAMAGDGLKEEMTDRGVDSLLVGLARGAQLLLGTTRLEERISALRRLLRSLHGLGPRVGGISCHSQHPRAGTGVACAELGGDARKGTTEG